MSTPVAETLVLACPVAETEVEAVVEAPRPKARKPRAPKRKAAVVESSAVEAESPVSADEDGQACAAKKTKLHKRGEKLNRVISKALKAHPEALRVLRGETVQAEIAKAMGTRVAGSAPAAPRKRTVFVTYTSENFARVRADNPELKPNQVFRELARLWREEVSKNEEEVQRYTELCNKFNGV